MMRDSFCIYSIDTASTSSIFYEAINANLAFRAVFATSVFHEKDRNKKTTATTRKLFRSYRKIVTQNLPGTTPLSFRPFSGCCP